MNFHTYAIRPTKQGHSDCEIHFSPSHHSFSVLHGQFSLLIEAPLQTLQLVFGSGGSVASTSKPVRQNLS